MALQHYESCIRACLDCAQACEHCAASCLGEVDVAAMAECIRLDQDCSVICFMAAKFMSRGSQFAADLCRLCAEVCTACGEECRRHDFDHCRECADACDACAEECRQMAGAAV
jgi:hypothetical protein